MDELRELRAAIESLRRLTFDLSEAINERLEVYEQERARLRAILRQRKNPRDKRVSSCSLLKGPYRDRGEAWIKKQGFFFFKDCWNEIDKRSQQIEKELDSQRFSYEQVSIRPFILSVLSWLRDNDASVLTAATQSLQMAEDLLSSPEPHVVAIPTPNTSPKRANTSKQKANSSSDYFPFGLGGKGSGHRFRIPADFKTFVEALHKREGDETQLDIARKCVSYEQGAKRLTAYLRKYRAIRIDGQPIVILPGWLTGSE